MQQLMVSFHGYTAPPEILEGVRKGEIAAFCFFRYLNVESPAQVRRLTGELIQAAAEGGFPPPIIGIDQEGGQLVAIAAGATELPGNMALGAARSPELAEKAGRVLGRELLAMGINLNFAPALDVNVNPDNPVIGIRSFGDDPALVAELGVALLRGIQAEGVIATAKHFPGHGDTGVDSHFSVPTIPHSRERIDNVELYPFREAIQAGVQAVLTAHVILEALDSSALATFSPEVLGMLRQEMGFDGLLLTDAMDMYAAARQGKQASVEAALNAGIDLVLLAHLTEQLELQPKVKHLARADSLARIQAARERIPTVLPSLDVVGCAEHQQIAQEIADKSITLVRDNGLLPLKLSSDEHVAVITVMPADLSPADTSSKVVSTLGTAIGRRHKLISQHDIQRGAESDAIEQVLQQTQAADLVIVGTISADQDLSQSQLVQALYQRGQRLIVIAMRTPYDLIAFPQVETYLCAYSIQAVTTEAIARVLFGEITAQGVLPCAIPSVSSSL